MNKMTWRDRLTFLVAVLLLAILGGAAGFFWMSNSYPSNNSVYTEKVTEKQVYLESSQPIQATQAVANSLVTIIEESKRADFLSLVEPFRSACFNVETSNCGLNAVVLTSDGIAASVSGDGELENKKLVAFDNKGKQFTVKVLSKDEANKLVFFQLYKPGDEQVTTSVSNFSFKPASFADLKLLQPGQQILVMKGNIFNGLTNIRQTLIASILSPDQAGNWPLAFSLDDSANLINLAVPNLMDGNVITDLNGNLIGLTLQAGGLVNMDMINNALNKYKKSKLAKLANVSWGLSVVKNSKQLAKEFSLAVDYGYIVARGVNEGKLLNGAVKKEALADRIGLKDGDLILEVDGTSVLYENLWDLLSTKVSGDHISMKVIRGKDTLDLEVKI